jgi:hypothetical protein
VFHGGSGSTKDEIKTAVQSGVVKMNVDTGASSFTLMVVIRGAHLRVTQTPSLPICEVSGYVSLFKNSTLSR